MVAKSNISTNDLGPANHQARVQAGALVDGLIYGITFRQAPPYLVAFDPTRDEIISTHEIPMERTVDSPGAWNLVALNDRYLYSVLHEPTVLIRFDREQERFDRLNRFPQSEKHLRCCRAIQPDGDRIVFSLKVGPDLFEWDHAAEELLNVGRVHSTALKAIDLAVTDQTVYVGGGTDAYLTAVDRDTRKMRDILSPALADETFIQSVAVVDDGRVVIGSSPSMKLAILDPERPADATIVDCPIGDLEGAITAVEIVDGTVYFTTTDPSYALWSYDLSTDTDPQQIATPIDHPTRDIVVLDDTLIGVGSGGYSAIWKLDPKTGTAESVRLGDVGLPKGVGNVQSLHAFDGKIYAGGSRVTDIHDPSSGTQELFPTPGEPKVMASVDDRLYQGVYGGAGLIEYSPASGDLRELAWLGQHQNRPRALHYHEDSGLLLMGTRPDFGQLGGALAAYDLSSDTLRSVIRHLVQDQTINAISSIGETVYLGTDINGGIGSTPTADASQLVAWNPNTETIRWTYEFLEYDGIIGLDNRGSTIYGRSLDGRLFGFEVDTQQVTLERQIGEGDRTGGLIESNELIYTVDTSELVSYDPDTDTLTVLIDDLDAADAWHNFPQVTIDDDGRLYVAKGKNLVQVKLSD